RVQEVDRVETHGDRALGLVLGAVRDSHPQLRLARHGEVELRRTAQRPQSVRRGALALLGSQRDRFELLFAAVREQVVGLVGRDLPRLPGRTVHAREGRPGGRDARERRVDGAGARHTGGDRRPGTDTAYPADGDGTGGRGGEGLLSTVGASLHDLVRVPTVEDLVELTLQDHVAQG